MWSRKAIVAVSAVVLATALLAGCPATRDEAGGHTPTAAEGDRPTTTKGAAPTSKITRPGLVAVDVDARREQLTGERAVKMCPNFPWRDTPYLLNELDSPSGYGLDERYNRVSAQFRMLGALCLMEGKDACVTVQDYALNWARNSQLGRPRGGYDDGVYWNDTLTVNMRLLSPMLAALSVAEQFSSLTASDRETLDRWLKRKVDQYEHGLRHLGHYKGGRQGTTARRAANNHAVQSSIVAMSYGAWVNDVKYFKTGIDQWFITLRSMRRDGSLPVETRRGARALFYHGRTITGLIQLAERAAVQGIDLYGVAPRPNKTIHQAIAFFINAVEQPDLVLKYARTNKSPGPSKNYKVQHLGSIASTMGWIAPYIARFPDHPNSRRLLARRPPGHTEVKNYLTRDLDRAVRNNGESSEWIGVDGKCFYADPHRNL